MTNENMDDVLQALRDELAAVSPSPEFQARVRQRVSGELDLLREQLAAVAPSPEFAVRVRQGIDEAQAARAASWRSFFGWRRVVPAAAAAAIVVAIVVSRRENPTVEQVTAHVTPAPVGPVATPPRTTGTAPVSSTTSPQPAGRRPQPRASTTRVASPGAVAAARPSDPFLEVITNQPAILRANRDRIRAASEAKETPVVAMPETNPEIVVPAVEVSPIVVKWMVEAAAIAIRRCASDPESRRRHGGEECQVKSLRIISVALLMAIVAAAAPVSRLQAAGREDRVQSERAAVTLKITVVISRFENEKKTGSLPFVLMVVPNMSADGRDGETTSLQMGAEVPVMVSGPPAGTPAAAAWQYRSVGTNITASAKFVDEGRFNVFLNVTDSQVMSDAPKQGASTRTEPTPAFQSFRSGNRLIMRDAQTVQYTAATDKTSGEVIKLDVTLNVIK